MTIDERCMSIARQPLVNPINSTFDNPKSTIETWL